MQYKLYILLALLISISGCSTNSEPDVTILDRIEISSPNGKRLDIGETTTLTISGFDQSGGPVEIEEPVEWSVNNDHVTIDADGVVTGVSIGESEITAAAGEVKDTFVITVWDSSAPRTKIYVSDAGNFENGPWQILKFDENGEHPEVFIDDNLAWPQDILFLEDQEVVLISNLNSGNINRHDANTGDFIDSFATGIGGPTRMKIGPNGLLYVLQWQGNGLVQRYQPDGTFVDNFTSSGINQSIGLDWDSKGNLYVSSFEGGVVHKFDSNGESMGIFATENLDGPTNIWFNGSGELLVNDWNAGIVRRYDTDGNFINNFITGLSQPEGIGFLNGNLLIGNGGTGAVLLYNSSGDLIDDIISSGTLELMTPNAVVVRLVNQESNGD